MFKLRSNIYFNKNTFSGDQSNIYDREGGVVKNRYLSPSSVAQIPYDIGVLIKLLCSTIIIIRLQAICRHSVLP